MATAIRVTRAQRDAAKLIVERSGRKGRAVSPAVQAIARATRPDSGEADDRRAQPAR